MTKLVRDLMHTGLITCKFNATLGQVAVLLDQHQVHALIVIDRDGRPIGIITDLDLMAGEWLSQDAESLKVMRSLTAADLMTQPVDSVEANIPTTEAVDLFMEKAISRLLVTDNGKPVGILSLSDFIASMVEKTQVNRSIVADVMSDAILVCRGKTPIASAARAMTSAGWRSVVVVDAKGKAIGVVSGLDLLPFIKNEPKENVTVRDVMHPALTIDQNASLREAVEKMIENHYHRLIVIDKENPDAFPLGAISTFDIVEQMARPDSVWQKQ